MTGSGSMRHVLRLGLIVAMLSGCAPELAPGREQDVLRVAVKELLLPMGDVLVVNRPSDCRSDGQTDAPLPAALFNALLAANGEDAATTDLRALSPRLRVDVSGNSPRTLSARFDDTVVAVSKVGILDDAALACLEVFGSQEVGFFLLFSRDGSGTWSLDSELHAWRDESLRPAEELPNGEPYEG